jgi:hypothetical protein
VSTCGCPARRCREDPDAFPVKPGDEVRVRRYVQPCTTPGCPQRVLHLVYTGMILGTDEHGFDLDGPDDPDLTYTAPGPVFLGSGGRRAGEGNNGYLITEIEPITEGTS